MVKLRRVMVIVLGLIATGVVWAWIGRTVWASTIDVASAGEQFVDPVEPFRMIAGSLLVAVPTVLLIRSGWSWVGRTRLESCPERSLVRSASHEATEAQGVRDDRH